MTIQSSLLQLMDSDSVRLSKSDKKLALIIKEDPRAVIHLSIALLASEAGVSEPTVVTNWAVMATQTLNSA